MKKNIVVSILECISTFTTNISTTNIKNKQAKDKRKLDYIKDQVNNKEDRENARKKRLSIKLDQAVSKKSFVYAFISTVATATSMLLSSLGITQAKTITDITRNTQNQALVCMIVFICFTIWQISFNSSYIKERFNKHHATLTLLQLLVITLSITSNYKFLCSVINPTSKFDFLYIVCFAVSFDIISLKFSALSQDCKYMNYSYKNYNEMEENTSILKMCIFVLTYKFKLKLKTKYLQGLKEYKDTFKDEQTEQKEENQKEEQNENINPGKQENKKPVLKIVKNTNDREYKKLKEKILNMQDDTPVTAKTLNISDSKYRKYKQIFVSDGIVYIGNQNRIYKQNILKISNQ